MILVSLYSGRIISNSLNSLLIIPYQGDVKSKIENRGNTKKKQEKHSRKLSKHQGTQQETGNQGNIT